MWWVLFLFVIIRVSSYNLFFFQFLFGGTGGAGAAVGAGGDVSDVSDVSDIGDINSGWVNS
jgi:hypothetical protein